MSHPPVDDLSLAEVGKATGAPAANVAATWPLVLAALHREGIAGLLTQIGVVATIGTETWISRKIGGRFVNLTFLPIEEVGSPEYFAQYDTGPKATQLGNSPAADGDGAVYKGYGLIQLTGLANDRAMSDRLQDQFPGLDLVMDPRRLLEPAIAAAACAAWCRDHGVAAAAEVGDWRRVRRIVNGGLNSWARFKGVVDRLLATRGLAS